MPRQLLSAGARKRRKSQRNKQPTQTFNPPQWRHRDDADKRRHAAEARKKRAGRRGRKGSTRKAAKNSGRKPAKRSPGKPNAWLIALNDAQKKKKAMFVYDGAEYHRQPGKITYKKKPK